MIKDFLHIEFQGEDMDGMHIHIIKKYLIKTTDKKSFAVNNFSVLLIKSGSIWIQIENVTQQLSARDLLVIPKNSLCTLHEMREKLQLFLLSFTPEFAFRHSFRRELVDTFYLLTAKTSKKTTLGERDFVVLSLIYKLIYYLHKDADAQGPARELKRISFNLFLYELRLIYAKHTDDKMVAFSRKEGIVIQFMTVLAIHCRKQHSAKFYAGAVFVTSGYLNRIVKHITGKNVKTIIEEAILTEAKELLKDSQLSITAIAEELEFSNASSFGVFFKRHTSFSPSEYRSNAIERFNGR